MSVVFTIVFAVILILFHRYLVEHHAKDITSGLCELVFYRTRKLIADRVGRDDKDCRIADSRYDGTVDHTSKRRSVDNNIIIDVSCLF